MSSSPGTGGALHHLELWTGDLAAASPGLRAS